MINTIDNIELARRDEQRTVEARHQSQVTPHWSSLDTCRDLLSLALTDCDTY